MFEAAGKDERRAEMNKVYYMSDYFAIMINLCDSRVDVAYTCGKGFAAVLLIICVDLQVC